MLSKYEIADSEICTALEERYSSPTFSHLGGLQFRNAEVFKALQNSTSYTKVLDLLMKKGSFQFAFEEIDWLDTDGDQSQLLINRASKTPTWPMGTHFWIRDNTFIASSLLGLQYEKYPYPIKWQDMGKKMLLSSLTIISSCTQLERFQSIIDGGDFSNPHNWPHIFLNIENNINAANTEPWMHKQDAWQILAYHVITALDNGIIKPEELTSKHTKFLNSICPFLEKVGFPNATNGGSWEEIEAERTSVIAWETALLNKIIHSKHIVEPASANSLLARGIERLQLSFDKECPNYPEDSVLYRDADSALIYLLLIDIPTLLNPGNPSNIFDEILDKVTTLRGSFGYKRYLTDSYQGLGYYQNETAQQLNALYTTPSGDSSGVEDFKKRSAIIPSGHEAEWTHFSWQLSSACAIFFKKTKDEKYAKLQTKFLVEGMAAITGEDEITLKPDENGIISPEAIAAFQIPECYNSEENEQGIMHYPSPHTPLYWSIAESLRAFDLNL